MDDYSSLTTKEEKEKAIAMASKLEELDAMWAAWELRGYSRGGLIYGSILKQKRALAGPLSDEEEALSKRIEARRKKGADLPPIHGKIV